ncbi:MAG: hypothetical protein FJY76_03775 [Candidatus Aenigmarchaeota archaeon]|nr:hypothetical protein [Candidatus Aenigmarchaeota archaeon]
MRMIDICVRSADAAGCAAIAGKLGWDGICVLVPPDKLKDFVKPKAGIDIAVGVEIEARKQADVSRNVDRFRRSTEIMAFRCASAEMNRVVLETAEADFLLGAWGGGMNHVLAALAKENNVAVAFELQPLIFSHGRQRTDLFQRMLECAKFVRKARAPFALSSGAQMPMDMRDPGELMSFGRLLGFQDNEIKKAMSDVRVTENRKRLSGKWIMPGVEMV